MELSKEHKLRQIDKRIEQYTMKHFEIVLDRIALLSADDQPAVAAADKRLKALEDAIKAIKELKESL